jgi:signal transduction histidine kinase
MQVPKLPLNFILFIWLCAVQFSAQGQSALIKREQHRLLLIRDSITYVNTLNRIGMLYHQKNPDSCFYYGFKAKAMATRLGYPKGEMDADHNIAVALYLKGLYSESLALYSKIIPAYRQQADTMDIATVLMDMSTVYLQIKDTVKAVSFCRRAIYTGKNSSRDSTMSMVYANYCIVNPALAEDSVRYYVEKSTKIATRYKDIRMLIVLQQLNARRLLAQGHKPEALLAIQQSLLAAQSAGMEYLEIGGLDLYATYYADKPDSVLAYYNRIYTLADTKGYIYLKVKVLSVILYYTDLAGNKDQQIRVHRLLEAAMAAENENTRKFIGDYVKYNAIQNDNQSLVRKDKGDKLKIGLLISVCVVVILLILIIYRFYRHALRLNGQIQAQNQTLQQADEFKNRLISILAHDFRTPLISTIGIARLMKDNLGLDVGAMEKFCGDIENDAQDMLGSFDTILQWIKQQLSGYQYQPEGLDLHQLFLESAAVHSRLLEAKKLIITNLIPENTAVTSDKEMLQFVNRNLLSNAIRFSPEYGSIKVNAIPSGDELIVSIEDSGPGMSADALSKLFSVSGNFGLSTQDGAGIALSMCRDFIQKLGGRIWAENKATKGAIFYYAIPYRITPL